MAVIIIIADENGNQLEKINAQIKSENWEEECYQIGCTVSKQIASQYLQEIEQKLFDEHDKALHMKDIKQRTILTRFGEVNVKRRLYQDRDGNIPPPGERKVSILYMEADGLWVKLQREEKEHYELKSAIAYEGWERHEDDSYSLLNKKVYCHGDDSIPFWQSAGIHFDRYWDLGSVNLVVLGGDDADWINAGVTEMGYCVRRLDGFHLFGSCCKGWENGGEIYSSIRNGDKADIVKVIGSVKERTGKTSEKERKHILRCLERGIDWRKKVTSMEIPEGARGLGAMEGNESNLFADRMKDRGMSWTISGA